MRKFYDSEFESAWKVYGVSGSKSKAYEAWKKTANLRPSFNVMMCCIAAYLEELNAYNKGRQVNWQRDKLHFSTFLSPNDMRWEVYLEAAERLAIAQQERLAPKAAAVNASRQSWPKDILDRLKLPEPVIEAWISPCVLIQGQPCEVVAPRKYHAVYLREKMIDKLQRVLGDGVKITYAS